MNQFIVLRAVLILSIVLILYSTASFIDLCSYPFEIAIVISYYHGESKSWTILNNIALCICVCYDRRHVAILTDQGKSKSRGKGCGKGKGKSKGTYTYTFIYSICILATGKVVTV